MFVPLEGADQNTMISDLRGKGLHTRNKQVENISSGEQNGRNSVGNNKKELVTIPLDLTKSQTAEEQEELFRRNSFSPNTERVNEFRNSNKKENQENQEKDRIVDDDAQIPDSGQRSNSASLKPMIPPPLQTFPGARSDSTLPSVGRILNPQEAILKLQQTEFEAQLHFLKSKHLEFIKNQQQIQQRQPIPPQNSSQSSISRCEECNINFTKHQNYVAHKKYYCAANSNKANPPPTPMQICNDKDEEDFEHSSHHGQQQISPRVTTPKKLPSPTIPSVIQRPNTKPAGQRTPSVSPSASVGSNQSIPPGISAMAMQAAAQAAISNFLAMSNSLSGKENATSMMNGPGSDLLMLKQQQHLLNKDTLLSKEAALSALKAAATTPPILSTHDRVALNGSNPGSATPSPKEKASPCISVPSKSPSNSGSVTLPGHGSTSTGLPFPHFCCEGCGIKFKSVSNLQAHQARYCAGLRKGAAEEGGGSSPFETMIKRMATQQQQSKNQSPSSLHLPPPGHLMGGVPADMMAFFNARSLEQQLQQAEAMKAAATAVHLSETTEKDASNPPTAGPAAMAAMAAAISAANAGPSTASNGIGPVSDNAAGSDDYCCILCGYKESSVERLKDHINMHFIGHVKKTNQPSSSPPINGNVSSDLRASDTNEKRKAESPHENESCILQNDAKRIKLEVTSATHGLKDKSMHDVSPPINRKSSEERRSSSSPKTYLQTGTPPSNISPRSTSKSTSVQQELTLNLENEFGKAVGVGGERNDTQNDMRCTACDIGFSQMSNFLAHKKYYCRGLPPSSHVSVDMKCLSPESGTNIQRNFSTDKDDDDDLAARKK